MNPQSACANSMPIRPPPESPLTCAGAASVAPARKGNSCDPTDRSLVQPRLISIVEIAITRKAPALATVDLFGAFTHATVGRAVEASFARGTTVARLAVHAPLVADLDRRVATVSTVTPLLIAGLTMTVFGAYSHLRLAATFPGHAFLVVVRTNVLSARRLHPCRHLQRHPNEQRNKREFQ